MASNSTRRQKKQNLEGIMAKDGQSPYITGHRTIFWQKIKISHQQEAVISGFTEPRGSRKKIGALVLGVYEKGKFVYIGHTGSGFNQESLNMLYNKLKPLIQKQSPFVIPPKTNAPVTGLSQNWWRKLSSKNGQEITTCASRFSWPCVLTKIRKK